MNPTVSLAAKHGVRRFRALRGALAAVCVLLAIGGTAAAQVVITPAITGSVLFPDTTVGATSPTQILQFTLTTAQTVHFSVPDSTSGPQDYYVGAVTGCVTDGTTVNPAGSICSVPVTFFPAYPGYRNVPLKAQTSTTAYYFGLSGYGLEPGLTYTTGNISTIAGTGIQGDTGDNGPATLAGLNEPLGLSIDYAGNVYVTDFSGVRRLDATTGLISTVVSAPAPGVTLPDTAVDAAGNLYIADDFHHEILKKDAATGAVSIYAGGGAGGDGVVATSSTLNTPGGLAVDGAGDLYIGDLAMACVRKVSAATGLISTVAGTCQGLPGASGPSTLGSINFIALDRANDLYIADGAHSVVWKLNLGTSALTVAAGTLNSSNSTGDGGLATNATLETPFDVAVDAAGDLYISDSTAFVIRKVTAGTQIITTIAGTVGVFGPNIGDGGPAAAALFAEPYGIALDGAGNLYVADLDHSRVREIQETATGPVTAPFLAPDNIDFGSLAVGTTGNYWTITLNNTTGVPVRIGSITLSDPVDFVETTNCGTGISAYSNCNIQVSFSPSAAGVINGTLVVTDNGGLSPQTVSLTGTGVLEGPTVVVSPNPISFASIPVGTTGNAWTVTLSNTSGYPLSITSILLSDTTNFSLANYYCGATLQAYSTCTVQVTFTPATTGPHTANLVFTDNATGSPQIVSLSGTATANDPTLFFSPASIDFGNQTVGTTSNSWTVTLNNTSGVNATFTTPITVTGPFAETDGCGTGLATHSTCNIVVTFLPAVTGPASGQLSVGINGANPVTPVPLAGTGTTQVPVLFFAPNNINFGTQTVGTTSNSWTVTLNNTSGTVATFLSPIIITGPFTESNSCNTTLPAYSTCNIVVSFAPAVSGPTTGQISAIINGVSTPLVVTLAGNGSDATPVVMFSPANVNFGNQTVGTASNGWTVTLNNTSDFPAPFATPIAITGDPSFTETDNCGTLLAAHSTCNVVVTFTPSATGPINGLMSVSINGGSPVTPVTLTGTGTTSVPVVIFSPTNIDFGPQAVGTSSNSWNVNLSNESGTAAPLTVPIAITGDPSFTETDNCGTSLPAYSTCNVLVTFTPSATGPVTGLLVAQINGSAPITVNLTGTGTTSAPVVTFAPTSIDFGSEPADSASNPWTVTLNNQSGTAITFSTPISFNGNPYFSQTNNCGTGLAAHSTCTVQVTFTPPAAGTFSGQLVVTVQGVALPVTVSLTGTGTSATLLFSPSSIDFGTVATGDSKSWTVTVSNTGNSPVTFAIPIQIASPLYFTQTNNCGTTVAAHSTCNVVVTFTPVLPAPVSDVLVMQAPNIVPQFVNLTGTGGAPALMFSTSSIDFGNQMLGTSNSWTVTLNNTGNTAVTFAVPVRVLAQPFFTQTNNCGTGLAAHSTCNVVVTFAPTTAGTFSGGYLIVYESGPYPPQLVSLTGTGVPVTSVVFYSLPNINFGDQLENTAGNAWTVTLNNTGAAAVPFSGVSLTDTTDFTQTNNCGTILPAFSTCTIQVAFTPSTSGVINGSLTSVIDGVTETVPLTGTGTVPPDYTLSVNPNTVSLLAGQTALATFTFTPVGGYTGTVNFYCTNLPVGVSCIFDPASVTADGSNTVQTAQLTIMTTGPYSGTVAANHMGSAPVLAALYLLPGTLLGGLIALRRRKLRGSIRQWMLFLLVLGLIGGMMGCGGFNHFTPAGQSVVTITSSASTSGTAGGTSNVHVANFTLTITQ